ncbi:peptidase family M1-domain-containing protein [Podospora australis]|uniref:Aminopeptidase n=1 Tax=Podospora australis TaxID=1536484 RepID=A0AAN6WPX3_9PEZI|nr:peptidase family M1-domain-containing protein [Podospora australis]
MFRSGCIATGRPVCRGALGRRSSQSGRLLQSPLGAAKNFASRQLFSKRLYSATAHHLSYPTTTTTAAISQQQQRPALLNPKDVRLFRPHPPARYCSYRRHNMCRTHAVAETASGVNVQGRELLPTNVVPKHYHVTLEPDLTNFTFDGTVVIDLDVNEDSNSIQLHTLELDVHNATITSEGQTISSSPKVSYNEDTQVTTLEFDNGITKGKKAQVEIKFTGQLNDKMAGFYRSTYKNPDGSTGILAVSQMEPTDARRSFPCFDEPSLKAEFTVTLIADKKLTCLSNMDVASEAEVSSKQTGGVKKAVTFNKSPLMSTYLVAFVVGELNYIETNDFRVPVRVYAPPGQNIEHGRFSLDLAARTLKFYEGVFGCEFPLPKMDQIAIPDFAQGAMENWGLVTYRVVDLLLDEKVSGAATKERVAEVVQHELAHQWFGNLVTMDWWDGLWLNEGFATWASWYSCNVFYPEWKVWETYVVDNLQRALSLDSLRSSHPIEVPVKRADEINQIFDAISYSKGSCVLRMISTYLGEDTFLEGVRRYLKKHAYGNTQTGDLWASLAEASGKSVEDVMQVWTKNIGFPVVTVTEKGDNTIELKQNRFLRTGDTKPEEDQVIYPVFLGLRTKDGVDESQTLDKREDTFKVPDDFFKLNANHTGLYRTSYSPERLAKLGEAAKKGLLSVEDRAGMIADAGALATSGYQKTSGVLSLLKGFSTEEEFVVWNEIIGRVAAVQNAWIFEDKKVRDGLEAFLRELVSAKAHQKGWEFTENDGHIEQQFKAMLFGSAGLSGDEKIIQAAKDMFKKHMAGDKSAIHPNIRGSVFSMALKHGGKEEYDAVLNYYRTSTNSDERNTALRTLGRAKDPELIKSTLDLLFSGEVKDQDIYMPTTGLRSHPEGVEALFTWMTENWDELVKKLPPALSMLGTMVTIFTSSFTKKEQLEKVEKFFADKSTNGFDQSLAQSLDAIRSKISWIERDREDVAVWVKNNNYSS